MVTRIGPKSGRPHRNYFKAWRLHRGLTQEQLADRIGTTAATVSRMEGGKVEWNVGYLYALAEALDVDDADLLRSPDMPSVDELLRRATPEQREQVLRVVRTMLNYGT